MRMSLVALGGGGRLLFWSVVVGGLGRGVGVGVGLVGGVLLDDEMFGCGCVDVVVGASCVCSSVLGSGCC